MRKKEIKLLSIFLVLLTFIGAIIIPGSTQAAEISGKLNINDLTFSQTSVKVGDTVDVSFNWDFSDLGAVSNGDTVTVNFGSNFELTNPTASDITIPSWNGVANPSIGTATISNGKLVITFNALAQEVNKVQSLNGNINTVQLTATTETTKPTPGDDSQVPVIEKTDAEIVITPPVEVGPPAPSPGPDDPSDFGAWFQKHGGATRASVASQRPLAGGDGFHYRLYFNPTYITHTMRENGVEAARPDGSTRTTIVFEDELKDGQTFSDFIGDNWILTEATAKGPNGNANVNWGALRNADGVRSGGIFGSGPSVGNGNDFEMSVTFNAEKTKATITLTGPWIYGADYLLFYKVNVPGGTQPNAQYRNTATVLNTGEENPIKRDMTIHVLPKIDASARTRAGYGLVSVTKKVEGEAASKVDPDTEYTVIANYTLPTQAQNYTDWEDKPADLSPTATQGTVAIRVKAGETVELPFSLPQLTKVEFSEDRPADGSGYTWASVGQFDSATVEIENQVLVPVNLTNVADPAETTTESTTSSTTTESTTSSTTTESTTSTTTESTTSSTTTESTASSTTTESTTSTTTTEGTTSSTTSGTPNVPGNNTPGNGPRDNGQFFSFLPHTGTESGIVMAALGVLLVVGAYVISKKD